MEKSIARMWDEKFSCEDYFYGFEPNAFIKSKADLIKAKGEVLCLGEGEGRNAVFLASEGFKVTALDASAVGISKALSLASKRGVSFNVELLDLQQWNPKQKYDGIVTSYLHLQEPLRTQVFQTAIKSLKTGGYFIAEFFSINQISRDSGGPKKEELLYTTNSLRDIFSIVGCEILYLEEEDVFLSEGKGHQGDALVVRVIVKKL